MVSDRARERAMEFHGAVSLEGGVVEQGDGRSSLLKL